VLHAYTSPLMYGPMGTYPAGSAFDSFDSRQAAQDIVDASIAAFATSDPTAARPNGMIPDGRRVGALLDA